MGWLVLRRDVRWAVQQDGSVGLKIEKGSLIRLGRGYARLLTALQRGIDPASNGLDHDSAGALLTLRELGVVEERVARPVAESGSGSPMHATVPLAAPPVAIPAVAALLLLLASATALLALGLRGSFDWRAGPLQVMAALVIIIAWLLAHETAHWLAARYRRVTSARLRFGLRRPGSLLAVVMPTDLGTVSADSRLLIYAAGPALDLVVLNATLAMLLIGGPLAGPVAYWAGLMLAVAIATNVLPVGRSDAGNMLAAAGELAGHRPSERLTAWITAAYRAFAAAYGLTLALWLLMRISTGVRSAVAG
ncbi:MAG: hypothetical protein U1F48_19620 [Burkholderiales bacterium]